MDKKEVNGVMFYYYLWHRETENNIDESAECVLMHMNDQNSLMVYSTQSADLVGIAETRKYNHNAN